MAVVVSYTRKHKEAVFGTLKLGMIKSPLKLASKGHFQMMFCGILLRRELRLLLRH